MTESPPDVPQGDRRSDVEGVPDAMLRSALELAVGIAAEGRKLRPPLLHPAGLKPFLKTDRLDASGLRSVRRALVGDEAFRDRLATVDMTELVDELGAVWLARPAGWESTLRSLVTAARQREAEASTAAALRKSEKRRAAAEHAASRALAELIACQDTLRREVSDRQQADELARAATIRAERLGDDNVGLQREVERLRAQLDQTTQDAERARAAAAETAQRLQAVESVRDDLLSRRHERSTPVANPALNGAAPSARPTGDAVTLPRRNDGGEPLRTSDGSAAPGETWPADVRPIRQRPSRRQPIPIPGGLYGDSAAAAEHLLRVPGVRVIVDGYNVAKAAWPQLELIDQREHCIAMLEDVTRRIGTDIRIVFDGSAVVGSSSRRRLVRVQFSPPGVSADDVIRAEITRMPVVVPAVVVTNDQAIVADVRASGVNVISTDTLLVVAGRATTR